MAAVKIDLAFGERAILSERPTTAVRVMKNQRDADEFLRRWPQARSVQQARGYLRQLGLNAGYAPPAVNPADSIALLRAAVKEGRVTVFIERAGKGTGGGAATTRSAQVESSRLPLVETAGSGGRLQAPMTVSASAPKLYSWMQNYDDVSADDLIAYIESVVGGTPGAASATSASLSTPLADAESYTPGDSSGASDLLTVAARGVGESDEAECYAQYERDMDECNAYRAAMGGARFMQLCSQRAFMNYQQCRGY